MFCTRQIFGALIATMAALSGTAVAQPVPSYNPYRDVIFIRKECSTVADWVELARQYWCMVTCPYDRAGIDSWGSIVDRRTGELRGGSTGTFRLGKDFPVSIRGLYAGGINIPRDARTYYAAKVQISCTTPNFPY